MFNCISQAMKQEKVYSSYNDLCVFDIQLTCCAMLTSIDSISLCCHGPAHTMNSTSKQYKKCINLFTYMKGAEYQKRLLTQCNTITNCELTENVPVTDTSLTVSHQIEHYGHHMQYKLIQVTPFQNLIGINWTCSNCRGHTPSVLLVITSKSNKFVDYQELTQRAACTGQSETVQLND